MNQQCDEEIAEEGRRENSQESPRVDTAFSQPHEITSSYLQMIKIKLD